MAQIHFDITGDNSNIVSVVNDTTKKMEDLSETMKELSQSFDFSNPEESIDALGKAIEGNERSIENYKKQLDELAASQANAALEGDTEAVKQYGEEMSKVAGRMQELIAENETLKTSLASISTELDNNSGIMVKLLGGQEKYSEIISALPGPLKNVISGLNGMTGAAKAFIATPLGAILAALILAYQAVTTWLNKSAEGQQALAKISGYLSGVLSALQEIVINVGKSIYKAFTDPKEAIKGLWATLKNELIARINGASGVFVNFGKVIGNAFKGDFKGAKDAAKDLANSYQKIFTGRDIDQIKEGTKAFKDQIISINDIGKAQSDLSARENKLHRDRTAWMAEEAELDKQIAEERNKLRMGSKSERAAASARMQELINQKTEKELALAKEEYEIKKASNALTTSSQEDLDEEERLRAKIIKIEEQGIQQKGYALRIQDSINRSLGASASKTEEDQQKEEQQRLAKEQSLQEELNSILLANQQDRLNLMEDGTKKEIEQIKQNYAKRAEEIRKQAAKWERENREANRTGLEANGLTKEQNSAISTASLLNEATQEKAILAIAQKNREKYLKEYGSYEEKRLAITEEYAKKIAATDDEFERKSLSRERDEELRQLEQSRLSYLENYGTYKEKELAITEKYDALISQTEDKYQKKSLQKDKEKELRELEQSYNSRYSLIFSNAESLTDNILQDAIEATQEAIKKAKDSGDIQALTELYQHLREQMNVKGERSLGWGWNAISEGLGLRRNANSNRSQADALEELLHSSEGSLDVMKEMGLDDEDIEAAREEINELRAEINRLRDDADNDDTQALSFIQKGVSQVQGIVSTLGSEMSSLRDGLGGTSDLIADIGDGLSAIGNKMGDISNALSGTMTKGDAITTIISGAIEMAGMIAGQIAENKRVQNEWNEAIKESNRQLAMLRLEALDYKQQNIFGVENPYKKAIDGAKQYSAAMVELQKQTAELTGGKVQTGTKKVSSLKNTGKGAGIGASVGAAAGSIIPAIGTAIGAAVGAIGGAIAGLFGAKKKVPVFENLAQHYGQLFDPETYELNEHLLADYDKLDDSTKKVVDNWEDIRKKAQEAEAQMHETFTNLSGDIGSQLSDSLVNAFKNGKLDSAVDDFHSKLSGTIEDIVEQMAFSNVFSGMFDDLQKDMEDSFRVGGDQSIVDDLMRFEQAYQAGLEEYGKQMEEARAYLKESGYKDVFTPEERTASSRSSLGASQESIDESNGRLTAIQAQVFSINETIQSFGMQNERLIANTAAMLEHTQGIHIDTTELKGMVSEMRELSRSVNRNVSQIVDKGVILR